MYKETLNDKQQIIKIDNILKKLNIMTLIYTLLTLNYLVFWLIFLYCHILFGFYMCFTLFVVFSCAIAFSTIMTDKYKQKKRNLMIKDDSKE